MKIDTTITLALFLFCLLLLFYRLGVPALFEPTEGRNAEIAREILLTHDWVTPHNDFLPVLDKPVFFYWLITFSYKLFGVSEWSARLSSALAGLGSVVLIYLFARKFLGSWEALWSVLILVSSVEFFALSRIVIFDTVLCFFITFSLCCFYWGRNSDSRVKKRVFYLLMYAAMGNATLVKGPIGLVLPGMVIFFYALLVKKKRPFLRELDLFPGVILFLTIVAPWYIWVEIRNPGYLNYYLWEENFMRFVTPHFHRGGPWYYFVVVLAVGFIPWTFLLPYVIRGRWGKPINETTLFLVLWTVLPFLFFSFSATKLSHYILPIYPPLAVLVGEAVASSLKDPLKKKSWPLWLPAFNLFLLFFMLVVGIYWPELLSHPLQRSVLEALHEVSGFLIFGMLLAMFWLALATTWRRLAIGQGSLYVLCCVGFALYFLFVQPIVRLIALNSSSKVLAEKSASLIHSDDQVVIYGTYRSSLPFYLKIERPIWVVWSGRDRSIMESFYIAEKQPQPAAVYGKALLTFEEFSELRETSKRMFFVFVEEKNLPRLVGKNESLPKRILDVNEIALVAIGN
jgi:4-amino-4-deoxy-L-arabinose transferase-like glycosyltransferase